MIVSFWDDLFAGAILVSGRVVDMDPYNGLLESPYNMIG